MVRLPAIGHPLPWRRAPLSTSEVPIVAGSQIRERFDADPFRGPASTSLGRGQHAGPVGSVVVGWHREPVQDTSQKFICSVSMMDQAPQTGHKRGKPIVSQTHR